MLAPKLKRHKPPPTLLVTCCCLLHLLNLAIIIECQDHHHQQQQQAGSDDDRFQKHATNLALSTSPVEQDRRQANLFRANNNENNPNDLIRIPTDQNDLSGGGGDLATADTMMSGTSDTSHEIIASGWPVTSSMWPSLKTELSQDKDTSTTTTTNIGTSSSNTWQPFIYADKPSKQDYSLLLSLNKTLIELLKINFNKQPVSSGQPAQMSVDLSFDYYFNQLTNATAPPGIKIELDRKEFDYLEPSSGSGGAAAAESSLAGGDQPASSSKSGRLIKSKMWISYNKRIMLTDLVQLDKPDWLKLSLVNREAPSLVAIRRLRVAFGDRPADQPDALAPNGPPPESGATPSAGPPSDQETAGQPAPSPSSSSSVEPPVSQASSTPPERAAPDERWRQSTRPAASQLPANKFSPQLETENLPDEPTQQPLPKRKPTNISPLDGLEGDFGPQPEASEAITSTIKPVDAKEKKGWAASIGLGRKRRQAGASADSNGQEVVVTSGTSNTNSSGVIELTCYQSDACEHWKTEQAAGQIQWSLARMPPSTDAVRNGYYYVSNRRNYGEHSGPLLLRLNQTETATITDQKTDHCIELALYVTERTHLRLFKGVKRTNGTETGKTNPPTGDWLKSSLLLTWAPTTTVTTISLPSSSSSPSPPVTKHVERPHLNGAQMAASNDSGWTIETLCFGQFFEDERKCGLAECAFVFEMDTQDDDEPLSAHFKSEENELVGESRGQGDEDYSIGSHHQQEQVVGVALLRKYAIGAPNKQASPAKWLEFWQRTDMAPIDNWKFYPQMDFSIQPDNVSLVNLYNEAQYSIHSDWIQMNDHLNLNASYLIEVLNDAGPSASEANQPITSTNGTQMAAGLDQHNIININNNNQEDNANELVFRLNIKQRLVNQHFETVHSTNTTIDWFKHYSYKHQLDLYDLSLANLSSLLKPPSPSDHQHQNDEMTAQPSEAPSLFKVIIELVLDCHWLNGASQIGSDQFGRDQTTGIGGQTQQEGASGPPALLQERMPRFRFLLANVSVADRCFPNPCQWGSCTQNGTGLEDWNCECDKGYRGRRCEFGSWCGLEHVVPISLSPNQMQSNPVQSVVPISGGGLQKRQFETTTNNNNSQLIVLKLNQPQQADNQNGGGKSQPSTGGSFAGSALNNKIGQSDTSVPNGAPRLTGEEFCRRKLGAGFRCQEIDLPRDERIYRDEGETFSCFCRDDYYLSDDGKCKQAHRCNSVVCPAVGQICDESRPFNETQPCHCNEKLDWYQESPTEPNKCVRRQCHDKKRDCGFDAHVCLATSAGERPVCKCGPKFTLKTSQDKTTTGGGGGGNQKYCQSTACVLPTLNDCEQICMPNDQDLQRPYTCSCHPGYALDQDGKSCKPATMEHQRAHGSGQSSQQQQQHKHGQHRSSSSPRSGSSTAGAPVCKPACDGKTQICTELGCRCRQGYVPEGEVIVQVNAPPSMVARNSSASGQLVDYVQSVRCLNVCSLSYAENKLQFERIESVCPLGLCDPASFNCRCSDPNSSALVQSKYEPIWANETLAGPTGVVSNEEDASSSSSSDSERKRASPLCHLKRVCQPESAGYQLCKARGAICVPDYTKPAMFDCVCPPTSEKRPATGAGSGGGLLGQQVADFNCEPRCSSIKQECIKKQAVCRMVNKDQARCECLPGMMLDKHDDKCYLAHYTYSMNLIIVNKYYEPSTRRDQLARPPNGKVAGGATKNNSSTDATTTDSDDDHQDAPLHEILPQFQRSSSLPLLASGSNGGPLTTGGIVVPPVYLSQQCNASQLLPKSVIEDPYEHEMGAFLQYIEQCNERLHEDSRAFSLNARLGEDLRQSLRQHLRESFTITTNNSLCLEMSPGSSSSSSWSSSSDGRLPVSYLNCTVFLQSMEPIEATTINRVFTNCDKTGVDGRFCWIKPRLLLMKSQLTAPAGTPTATATNQGQDQNQPAQMMVLASSNPFNFKQIVPCELDGFCGPDARSERLDDTSSLCSCKCPPDIEMIDLREMEPRLRPLIPQVIFSDTPPTPLTNVQLEQANTIGGRSNLGAIKEICAPRNHCGPNSTYCSLKTGSICHYDIRIGSRCNCVYPAYEDELGRCVEITFSQLDNTLIVIIIMVGTCLIVSLAINLYALAKSKRGLFGKSRQYPLSEFSSSCATPGTRNLNNHHQYPADGLPPDGRNQRGGRPFNRSTGVPNLAFDPDD